MALDETTPVTELQEIVRPEHSILPAPTRIPSRVLGSGMDALARRVRQSRKTGRILYVPGPGNVTGTYTHWTKGTDDPSIPSVGYSAQIYEVARHIGAKLVVLTNHSAPVAETDGSVRFLRTPPMPNGRGVGYHLKAIRYGFSLVSHALRHRADTIIVQRNLAHFWPLGLARLFGIRLVLSLHNTLWPAHRPPTRRERLVGWLNGWLFRRAARVIGVSATITAQVRAVAGPAARTAVQVPQYKEANAHAFRVRASDAPLRDILYLGRIEENKGVFDLLDSFTRICRYRPDLRLRFVGSGGALEALRARAAGTIAADRIEVPGPCDGDQVFAELTRADLLVCPTTSRFAEGLAKTPVEAALAGVPSIVSAVVPVADLLGDATRVVPVDDPEALADALDCLASEPGRLAAMSRAASEVRAQFFDRRQSLGACILTALADEGAPKRASSVPVPRLSRVSRKA